MMTSELRSDAAQPQEVYTLFTFMVSLPVFLNLNFKRAPASLPSIAQPVKNKKSINKVIFNIDIRCNNMDPLFIKNLAQN